MNITLKKLLRQMSTLHGINQRELKKGWAELFRLERTVIRQKFVIRLMVILITGFMFGLILRIVGF